MNKYQDRDGNPRTLAQMVSREPQWAENRIKAGEAALEVLALVKKWDIDQYTQHNKFTLPQEIRERIQKLFA